MLDQDLLEWPEFLKAILQQTETVSQEFILELVPARKLSELTDLGDYLLFSEGILFFRSIELGLMSFDLEELALYHQRQHYAITQEPLARALGIKGRNELTQNKLNIWDTTCGTGKDLTLIQHFGAKITAFERHPAIYLLLKDALRRFPLDINLKFGDAHQMPVLESARPDVIYYDPMYPVKKKSALPRKEMRILKDIVGEDNDSAEFLKWALKCAKQRIVVKRPLEAKPIQIKEKPTASYIGKSVRYDMYKIF